MSKENYTEADVTFLTENYDPEVQNVKELAEALGRTVASVRAKLSQMQLYRKVEKVAKATRVTKADLVAKIGAMLGVQVPSLEKATLTDLDAIAEAVSFSGLSAEDVE